MINRAETGQAFGLTMRVTPEHIGQALARTSRDVSNIAFLGILRSIAQPKIEQQPEPEQTKISPREQERLDNLAAKRARHADNVNKLPPTARRIGLIR